MSNTKNNLREYPQLSWDPFMDFEFSREMSGRGFYTYAIREIKMPSGETLVFTLSKREGDERVDTPLGPKRLCETDVMIEGYKVESEGIFKYFKKPKIRSVPEEEKKEAKSRLLEELKKYEIKKLGEVDFYREINLESVLK